MLLPTLVLQVSVHKGQGMKSGGNTAWENILEIFHKKSKEFQGVTCPVKGKSRKGHLYNETGNLQVSAVAINVKEEKSH